MKLRCGLPSLRRGTAHSVLIGAFRAMRERAHFRLVHYSIQSNHLHFVCEALDRRELTLGVQSLAIRIAKGLNALWQRAGELFADRYHDRILRTPREVRNVLRYVLTNSARHGVAMADGGSDPYSSARWFDISLDRGAEFDQTRTPLARARTWLLSTGWLIHERIDGAAREPTFASNG
jgi:REP element-mobilizing transposase RayT